MTQKQSTIAIAIAMVDVTPVADIPEYHFGTSDKLNDLQTILSN
jgi:hypothetical protein